MKVRHLPSLLALALALPAAADTAPAALGRRLYEQGLLVSGAPLRGERDGGTVVEGAAAACVQCHRRSGMGVREGRSVAPPIAAPALFGRLEAKAISRPARRAPGITYDDFHFRTRPPYDDASLALAIRSGRTPGGQQLQYLMPRYALGDSDMAALIAYLRTLSAHPSPGADERLAHFATVITPDTEPAQRKAYLDVLKACFDERYPAVRHDPRYPGKAIASHAWKLHVWELSGPPTSWAGQLAARHAEQPVFAMVSGLGRGEWEPVHRFCESEGLPCLFPNVLLPGDAGSGDYSFYFSRGALLDAEVLARHFFDLGDRAPKRLVQIAAGPGEAAAATLRRALADRIAIDDLPLPAPGAALPPLPADAALVLWLDAAGVAALTGERPPPAIPVYLSGTLANADRPPLPPAWQRGARIVYPFDPPGNWARRMRFNLQPWLSKHGLKAGDQRLQGNTLTACNLLFEGMLQLRGQYLRDHLVETVESYSMGNQAAPSAFPRFSLGPGQRFGSKGASIVRFGAAGEARIVQESDWIVP